MVIGVAGGAVGVVFGILEVRIFQNCDTWLKVTLSPPLSLSLFSLFRSLVFSSLSSSAAASPAQGDRKSSNKLHPLINNKLTDPFTTYESFTSLSRVPSSVAIDVNNCSDLCPIHKPLLATVEYCKNYY